MIAFADFAGSVVLPLLASGRAVSCGLLPDADLYADLSPLRAVADPDLSPLDDSDRVVYRWWCCV